MEFTGCVFPYLVMACIPYFDQELLLLADEMNQYNNFSMQFFSLNIQFFNRSVWGLNKGVLSIFFVTILIESLTIFCSFTTANGEAFPVFCDMKNKGMAVFNIYIYL